MNSWDLNTLELRPRLPEILSSGAAARAIALDLAAGEGLADHEVHERAWVLVLDGAIEVTTAAGERASGGVGLLIELRPGGAPRGCRVRQGAAAAVADPVAGQWPSGRDDGPGEALRPTSRSQASTVSPCG